MKHFYIIIFIAFYGLKAYSQPPNDNCANATTLTNVINYCSNNAQFTTVGASGDDVWFVFTARAYDVTISVTGNTNGGGTLLSPSIALFSDCIGNGLVGTSIQDNNQTVYNKGGLLIGSQYYIRVNGTNTGTFKICINNFNPIIKPGQDYGTASNLCSKEGFTQNDVTGAGTNNMESKGTCLDNAGQSNEQNTAWYKWIAANDGTLTFTITPTANDDIDWVLFDLGTTDNPSQITAANAIRCAAGRGIDCPLSERYQKTGINLTALDLSEAGGCGAGKDGFVKFVDMQKDHIYALLVNNFDTGNNGFSIEFGGTGEFLGPQAKFSMNVNQPCSLGQNYVFTNQSTNYTSLKWTFGAGASIPVSTAPGPHTITYSTPGIKTVVLEAIGDKGCFTVASQTFTVGVKPPLPVINNAKAKYCIGETITLNTPDQANAVYAWTGPNGFTSALREISVPVNGYNVAGVYTLTITIFGCTSDVASVTIPAISKTPVTNFSITENNVCTTQQSYTFTNLSTDYSILKWSFGAGASQASANGEGPFTITYNSTGAKSITLEAQSDAGCIVSLVKTIDVPAIPVQPLIASNKPDFCLNDTIFLSTDVQAGATYQWTGPDNFISDQPAVSIPVTGFEVSGEYTLVVSMGRCNTSPVSVTIPPILRKPTAAFSSIPNIPAKLSLPVTVKFQNQSMDADSYLWDFGDGETSTETNPSHTYNTVGDFNVSLTAFKSNVCSTSIVKGKFVIKSGNGLFIPNTFTPNGDGVNDEFVVTITNLVSYHIRIFNRYGISLFESGDIFDNWKGLYKGEPLPVGTYYYVLEAVDLNGVSIKESGPVTVIR